MHLKNTKNIYFLHKHQKNDYLIFKIKIIIFACIFNLIVFKLSNQFQKLPKNYLIILMSLLTQKLFPHLKILIFTNIFFLCNFLVFPDFSSVHRLYRFGRFLSLFFLNYVTAYGM